MFGFFIIRKLFDISCISDHVQPISKPLSVVLAQCGHFVVTKNEAQKQTRNVHVKFTFNSAIQCSSKML